MLVTSDHIADISCLVETGIPKGNMELQTTVREQRSDDTWPKYSLTTLPAYTTPRSEALFLMPLPRAAARLIAIQLNRKPVNLKNATLDRDLSSRMVREDANIERRTAGVTGKRLEGFEGGCPLME